MPTSSADYFLNIFDHKGKDVSEIYVELCLGKKKASVQTLKTFQIFRKTVDTFPD